VTAYGTLPTAGELHWWQTGKAEGRKVTFNPAMYLNANASARSVCGTNQTCATKHYIDSSR
jgi:hypothetical protein